MKNILKFSVALFSISASALLFAVQDEFCAGFEEGYKTIKGDVVIVPISPITPIDSTDFREGIKAGLRAAGR
jgi:hypothetical protein